MKKVYLFITMALALFSCNDYLDIVPEDDVLTIPKIFENKNGAQKFYTTCYQGIFYGTNNAWYDPATTGADELTSNGFLRNGVGAPKIRGFDIASSVQNLYDPYNNIWGSPNGGDSPFVDRYVSIRNCNTFIAHIDDVRDMEAEEKRIWKAEVKAVKAWYYFELIRQYGPIVLVPENIPVTADIEEMKQPRMHVDSCFKAIYDLLDEAIPDLMPLASMGQDRRQSINREAAYALKARAAVYAASPLFNGNPDYAGFMSKEGKALFNTTYDPIKWETAGKFADQAIEQALAGGRELENGFSSKSSFILNKIRDIKSTTYFKGFQGSEWLWAVGTIAHQDAYYKYPRFEKNHRLENGYVGVLNPTIKMVESYYTVNGLPISMDKTWNYVDRYKMGEEQNLAYSNVLSTGVPVLNLHLRREPRFYASIGFDKGYWEFGNNDYELMSAQKGGNAGIQENNIDNSSAQNITGYWCKKGLPVGEYSNWVYRHAFPIFRLAELYLYQAEAWNEFLDKPNQKVYDALDAVRERAGIPAIQTAFNAFATNPEFINTKEGMRYMIRQETNIELAFESHRFWNIRRWKTADAEMNQEVKGWNVLGDTDESFYNQYNGPRVVWNQNKFLAPRDYFWPIGSEQVLVAGVKQNLDW